MGIVPKILKMLIDERTEVKKAYKKDPDNIALGARSMALKILANSFYGYLGYARSRWYSRDCAGSVTAYGRQFIMKVIQDAESFGFKSLYTDTDSVFILMDKRSKEDVFAFLKKVNSGLPSSMELELEDFYTSGVFVGKRGAAQGAKKKYALLSESGRVKIKGFELVRRDWANIARETQKAVLEAILKEGSKEKAVEIVKDVIKRLMEGKIEIKDLAIHTQLRKSIRSYDITSPEVSAARKAVEEGKKRVDEVEGVTIGYVITKHGNSISEKAQLEDLATDYDPNYYIDHQIIPATLKILKELGYNAEELKSGGAQKKL
jgi:DNA polymerase I